MSKLPRALVVAFDRIDLLGVRARAWALLGMIRALRRLTERARARARVPAQPVTVRGARAVGRSPRRAATPVESSGPRDDAFDSAPPAPPAPTDLLEQLASGTPWEARRDAALALRAHPGVEVREALLRAIGDASVEVALAACEGLVEVGQGPDARYLLELASTGGGMLHPFTRAGAVWAAGALACEDDAPMLATLVQDSDAEVSAAALEALGRVGAEADLEVLWSVLEDGHGYYLAMSRQAAAKTLAARGAISSPRAALLLAGESDPVVRSVLGD